MRGGRAMGAWYVRTRGRVVGPLTDAELDDLRERGQVKGFDEVSRDRRTWQALDLALPPPGSRRRADADDDRPPRREPPPPPETNRTFVWVVGGVVAVLL